MADNNDHNNNEANHPPPEPLQHLHIEPDNLFANRVADMLFITTISAAVSILCNTTWPGNSRKFMLRLLTVVTRVCIGDAITDELIEWFIAMDDQTFFISMLVVIAVGEGTLKRIRTRHAVVVSRWVLGALKCVAMAWVGLGVGRGVVQYPYN